MTTHQMAIDAEAYYRKTFSSNPWN